MASRKISQLTAGSTPLAGAELVPIVQTGTTVKTTAQDIADLTNATGSNTEIQFNDAGNFGADSSFTFTKTNWGLAQGDSVVALGDYSHAEGQSTVASGSYSHAEGSNTVAVGEASHTEGSVTQAIGDYSHAEGIATIATGEGSHAEGDNTQAIGFGSHAEGIQTQAVGEGSHAAGYRTVASGSYQVVVGEYNMTSSAQSAFIVGNGTSNSSRSNLIFASGSQVQITGSLGVTQGITGSLFGTSSWAVSASWAPSIGGGTPGGLNTHIQFNSSSVFSGSANLTYNYNNSVVNLTGSLKVTGSTLTSELAVRDEINQYSGIITASNLSANRSYRLPNESGTIQVINYIQYTAALYYDSSNSLNTYVYYNNIGDGSQDGVNDVSWSYNTGNYTLQGTMTSGSPFRANKTYIQTTPAASVSNLDLVLFGSKRTTSTQVIVRTYNSSGSASSGSGDGWTAYVDLRVYD